MTVKDWVKNNARRHPDKVAVVSGNFRYTFQEFAERSNRLTNSLLSMGLKKGDRVAILDSNCPWYMEFYHGVMQGGMIAVPLNYRLTSADFIYQLNDSGAQCSVSRCV